MSFTLFTLYFFVFIFFIFQQIIFFSTKKIEYKRKISLIIQVLLAFLCSWIATSNNPVHENIGGALLIFFCIIFVVQVNRLKK